jgi:hypothetical protein
MIREQLLGICWGLFVCGSVFAQTPSLPLQRIDAPPLLPPNMPTSPRGVVYPPAPYVVQPVAGTGTPAGARQTIGGTLSPVTTVYSNPVTQFGSTSVPAGAVTYRGYVPVTSVPAGVVPVITATPYRYGRGILGQPKVYVSGQPVRNALRYLSP